MDTSWSGPTERRICSALHRLAAGLLLPGRCQPITVASITVVGEIGAETAIESGCIRLTQTHFT
jgi:hypothetical protein